MEYSRLSSEQFNELNQEFATFLAANSLDKKEWDQIKTQNPSQAEEILDRFSDLVWNDVLDKNLFIEHLNPQHLFLFECLENHMQLILIKTQDQTVDFTRPSGLQWIQDHFHSDSISLFQSQKKYSQRKHDIYDLIQKGGQLSNGSLFKSISSFLSNPT